jgi:hypothetical protein
MLTKLFAREDSYTPVDVDRLTEDQCQDVVASVRQFFREFLDTRPWCEFGDLSFRAKTLLTKQQARTLGDVKRCLMQAMSNQGMPGAGRCVQYEWKRLINEA